MKKKILLNLLPLIIIFLITRCNSEKMYNMTKTNATIIITDISEQKKYIVTGSELKKN